MGRAGRTQHLGVIPARAGQERLGAGTLARLMPKRRIDPAER